MSPPSSQPHLAGVLPCVRRQGDAVEPQDHVLCRQLEHAVVPLHGVVVDGVDDGLDADLAVRLSAAAVAVEPRELQHNCVLLRSGHGHVCARLCVCVSVYVCVCVCMCVAVGAGRALGCKFQCMALRARAMA